VIYIDDLVGKPVPFRVEYPGNDPITVVGYGDAGLRPLCGGAENTTVIFSEGGWLWLPDLLRYYLIVDDEDISDV